MGNKNTLILNGKDLTIKNLEQFSSGEIVSITISKESLTKMQKANSYVKKIVESGDPIYGINTGFGALSNKHIPKEDLEALQYNLVRSHCTGVGEPFSNEITKMIMLIRANCLCRGFSGINPEIVQLLVDFLNHNIIPIVPKKGSVGASGDLAPLSHIAITLIGEGHVIFNTKKVAASHAIKQIGKKPISLGPKDGLSLINGTAVMAALQAQSVIEGKKIIKSADIISSVTLESVKGTKKAFDPLITQLKPHPGQIETVENLNKILSDSPISSSHEECDKVQDPYSLRCIPQVHGAIRQTLRHAEDVLQIELNSVTDNPLVFPEKEKILSGGNFHGEALALSMDYLAMGISEVSNISERRIEKMMNPSFSDLPAFLTESSGLNSGLMIAHVTAAALASENKTFTHPASTDSIPTSTDKEDHVSMGVTSGLKLLSIIENTKHCLAIELLCSTQALEFQRPLKSSDCIEAIHARVRKDIPKITNDRVLSQDIEEIKCLIENNEIINEAEAIIGEVK